VPGEKEESEGGGRGGISRENVATQHTSRPMAPCDRGDERSEGKEVERTLGIVIGGMRLRAARGWAKQAVKVSKRRQTCCDVTKHSQL
jgi:hypothetical protein